MCQLSSYCLSAPNPFLIVLLVILKLNLINISLFPAGKMVSFASRGTLMDTAEGGRGFSFRFWCALFFFLLASTLFSWRVGHPTELTPSEFPWHTHGHLPRKFCRLHKAASQQVQQHPQWVTSNKSKKCALLKCTKNSY